MALAVRIDVDGDEAARLLDQRLSRLRRLARTMHKEIGEMLVATARDSFDRQAAPDGTPWEPLADATIETRNRRFKKAKTKRVKGGGQTETKGYAKYKASKRTLVESGLLRQQIFPVADADGVVVASNRVYARVHQFGIGERSSLRSRRRMPAVPARPFVGVSDSDWGGIRDLVRRYTAEALGTQG
ncbi:MAG: phage virion morphogenesis protein [Bacteroidetes bacterium]|nr:phage virion morphogenesis protein [Bacteroidota bacterium]